MENLKTLQCRLDGAIRWNFEGFVSEGLSTFLQFTLIAFIVEWVAYLHWQGNHVSYPINGLSISGGFLVVVMLGCASWDRWCPYQTPYTTTIPKAIWTWLLHCSKIRVDFFQAFAYIRQPISGLRSQLSLFIFRREETDEVMNLKSLCWMLENAPLGPPSLRVARHISSIWFRNPQGIQLERIMASPHLFRLHLMFWHHLIKIKWIFRDNPSNTNDHIEMLEHLSILGSAFICTSPQWTDGIHPLPMLTMTEIFKVSFESEKQGPKNAICWKGQSVVLILPPYLSLVCEIYVHFFIFESPMMRGRKQHITTMPLNLGMTSKWPNLLVRVFRLPTSTSSMSTEIWHERSHGTRTKPNLFIISKYEIGYRKEISKHVGRRLHISQIKVQVPEKR